MYWGWNPCCQQERIISQEFVWATCSLADMFPPLVGRKPVAQTYPNMTLVVKLGNLRKFWSFFSFIPFLLWYWTSFFTSLHPKKSTSSTVLLDALDPPKNVERHNLGGGSKYFWFSPRSLGRWSNLTYFFSKNGLVQPPTVSNILGGNVLGPPCWVFLNATRNGVVRCFHHAWPLVPIPGTGNGIPRFGGLWNPMEKVTKAKHFLLLMVQKSG